MEHTVVKVVGKQEYVCLMTNNIKDGDLIISSSDRHNASINKVTFVCQRANMLRYDKVSGSGNHSFGISSLRSMTNLSHIVGRKCSIELDILYPKIITKGVLRS